MIKTERNVFQFLSGGGEMGKLMREKDWQLTAVGDPSGWPQSLKTSIYIVLNAKFPMFLWWGDQLICFYNDAYRPSLGQHGKHPGILGMPAQQAWTEIWDVIKPLIDQVLQGESTFSEDQLIPIFRNNQLEDVYWTFSYSPVMGEQERPEGVLVTCQETTEKVRSLKELREREDQLLFTIEAADLGTWDLNPSTNTFKGNERLKSWFGLGPDEEIELSSAINAIAEADRQRVTDAIQNALRPGSGGHYKIEYGILNPKTGIEKKVLARGKALFGRDGKAYRFSGTLQDLSEEKKAYEKLHKNEERLNLVIGASELGIWEWDPGIDHIIYSDRLMEIFGLDPDIPIHHLDVLSMIHPEDRSARDTAMQDGLRNGSIHYEVRIIWKDGSMHWIEAKGRIFLNDKQEPYKAIGTLRDITQEKYSRQELIQSEEKFRLLADSMPQFIWTADPLGNLNYFNKAVYEYSGLSTDHLSELGWIQIVHPEESEKNISQWIESVESGRPFYFEHRFRRYDGVYRWQMSRAVPQKDDEGQIQMWVGTSTDIEEQKIFARELERQVKERTNELVIKNMELNKMNAELESFAYISSHDMQEPLRKIQIFASLVKEDSDQVLSKKAEHYFERIQASANRMQVLIEDLLTYSRLGATSSVFIDTDLSSIIADTLADLAEKIKWKKAVVETGPLCSLTVIPYQFRQMMTNLITNSLKFSRSGITPIIKIAAWIKEGICHIRFSDNGIGFDEEYKDKIFEVFQRLHNKTDYEGTGIGLSIVKKIVENHNGSIKASSHQGQGTTFDIYIPTNLSQSSRS